MTFYGLTISTRLLSMVATSVLGMLLIGGFGLAGLHQNLEKERKNSVKQVVDVVYNLLQQYQDQVAAGEQSLEQAQQRAIAAIRQLRYGHSEYFWILDQDAHIIMHPFRSEHDEFDLPKLQSNAERQVFVRMTQLATTQNAGFVRYHWYHHDTKELVEKAAYVKNIPAWGWIIGAGMYIDDVNKTFLQQVAIATSIGITILGITLLISIRLSRSITKPLSMVVQDMTRLTEGNLSATTIPLAEKGEIGELQRAMIHFRTSVIEMEQLRQEQQELKRREEEGLKKLSRAVEQSPGSTIITDRDGKIEYVNAKFIETTGYSLEEVLGKNPRILKSEYTSSEQYSQMWETITSGEEWRGELYNRKKNGDLYWEFVSISPIKSTDGEINHYLSVQEDITLRKEYEQALYRQANFDTLTGLPNRLLAFDRLEQALTDARRKQQLVAVLFIDLDNFKNVNDSIGHAAGDQLLIAAAQRLKNSIRASDTAARLGGDEFLVVLSDLKFPEAAVTVARHILDSFAPPFIINDYEFFIGASIGITTFPDDGSTPQILLQNADAAMYQAKGMGRNAYQYFSPQLNKQMLRRLEVETQLHHALERHELSLHYQPLFDIEAKRPIGAEALLRWHHPTLGTVSPDEFIPIAEETGIIIPIGEWVLETACCQMQEWNINQTRPLYLTINISARQLLPRNFPEQLQRILDLSGLPARQLKLEITEGLLMKDTPEIDIALATITQMGVRLSIDDFGTGYSSLSYLQRFPVSTLKIDRVFINDVISNPANASLVTAIIAMAHSLELNVVAEGVEQHEQLEFLREQGCRVVQGYYFSRPLSSNDFEAYRRNNITCATGLNIGDEPATRTVGCSHTT